MSTTELAPPRKSTILVTWTEEQITRLKAHGTLTITDIHDKSQLRKVHDARMELVKARTNLDKTRKELNEEAKQIIDQNNAEAKRILAEITPTEDYLKELEARTEKALDDERQAAADRLYTERVASVAAAGGTPVPELTLRNMSDDVFDQHLIVVKAQTAERERLAIIAEEQRVERERLEKLAREEREEAERKERAERMLREAAEQERLKVEAAQLAMERMELERQRLAQEEAARVARDAEQRRLAEERAALEMERQQQIEEAERLRMIEVAKLETQQRELDRQREELAAERRRQEEARQAAEAEATRIAAEEQARKDAEAEAIRKAEEARLAEVAAEKDRKRLAAMKPDLEKLRLYVASVKQFATEKFPQGLTKASLLGTDISAVLDNSFKQCEKMLPSTLHQN